LLLDVLEIVKLTDGFASLALAVFILRHFMTRSVDSHKVMTEEIRKLRKELNLLARAFLRILEQRGETSHASELSKALDDIENGDNHG
jgi:hypothetical protein